MEGEGRDQISQGDRNDTSCQSEESPKSESDAQPPETGPAGDSSTTQDLPAEPKSSAPPEANQELPPSSQSQDADNNSPRQEPTIEVTNDTERPVIVTTNRENTLPKCLRIANSDSQRSGSLRSQTRCKGTKNGGSKDSSLRGASRKATMSDKTSTGDSTFFSPSKAYCWICLESCKITTTTENRVKRVGRCLCCSCCSGAYTEPDLSSPCGCTGTLQYVHRTCLRRWVREQGSHSCRICNEFYHIPPAQSLCQRLSEEGVVGTCCPSLRSHSNTVVFITLLVLFVGVISTLGYSTANTYMELKKQSMENPEGGASTMIILVFGLSLSLLIVLSVLMCVYLTCVTKLYYRNRRGSYDVPTGDQAEHWEEFPMDEILQASDLEYQELQTFWRSLPPEVREIAAREGFVFPAATPQDEAAPEVEGTSPGEAHVGEVTPPGDAEGNTAPREAATPPTESTDNQESSGTQRIETVTAEI
ncbi:uncharacterized protein LOC118416097 [Branchiostoma floridae]|uniref:Uncharacterized protein LOC118416097 n=1 Tax=Branchiostoma floridae TaxID=7739 RepID=C3YPS9_BRAFL|nr:uncharacterized protein LOC118416097 [Branchiostoma floridae]|eukprot:XP_002601851.1 hypothetical protein BRAFLDRAFT_121146 [Branchiostoma floridae]